MSRWMKTQIKTLSNIEPQYFEGAMDYLGYYADFDQKKVSRSYEGDTQDVHCVLVDKASGKSTNIGLKFTSGEDGTVNMTVVCDWYYTHMSDSEFESKFTIAYNRTKVVDKAYQQGFSVESEEVMADGRTMITLTRAA